MSRGVLYAAGAYIWWGLIPLYFKAVASVPALDILAHRVLWALLFLLGILGVRHHWRWLRTALFDLHTLRLFALSATLLSANWGIFIWSVSSGHVVDASLGYFINPLVNVLIGVAFLKERLRALQWAALALAAAGVAWLTFQSGHPPWIGLSLAVTFAVYGLIRRNAALGALEGLTLETLLLAPVAAAYLWWVARDHASFVGAPLDIQLLLVAAGPITAIPLLLFAAGARLIPFTQLGVLQYFAPTLQLAIGVLLFGEAFGSGRAIGYGLIWLALIAWTLEALWDARRPRDEAETAPPV